ncbi:unnamed protein product [Brachionus calyciflorus]|uniref:Uncharacterized protein n=1 Tax=Brachionus calyciflorus TaxID=104777 RepID=A0A814CDQ3_9BILA|nr:unnamed protein product [Brachionus calyciflorus]
MINSVFFKKSIIALSILKHIKYKYYYSLKLRNFYLYLVLKIQFVLAKNISFECDFDSDNCNYLFSSSLPNFGIAKSLFISELNRTITDVSSIRKPAQNGLYCQVPFSFNQSIFYHCTNSFECITQNSNLSKCADGKFVQAKYNDQEPFKASIVFNKIFLSPNYCYELNYDVLMYSDSKARADYISVKLLNLENNIELLNEYYYFPYIGYAWETKKTFFEMITDSLRMTIEFGRLYKETNASAYYGFDNIVFKQELCQEISTVSTTLPETTSVLTSYDQTSQSTFDDNSLSSHQTTTASSTSISPSVEEISSSTTIVSTVSTTLPETTSQVICDFDNDINCIYSYAFLNFTQLVSQFVFFDFTYLDWNSFNSPTKNNSKCIIPFLYEDQLYNSCTFIGNSFKCLTSVNSNRFEECSLGNFLISSSFDGEPYSESTYFNLKLIKTGKYKISFHVVMVCNDTNCYGSFDYLKLIRLLPSSPKSNLEELIEVTLGNIGSENLWIEKSIFIEILSENDLDLKIKLEFGRKYQSAKLAFIGFDNLRVLPVEINGSSGNIYPILLGILITIITIVCLLIGLIILWNKKSKSKKKFSNKSEEIEISNIEKF